MKGQIYFYKVKWKGRLLQQVTIFGEGPPKTFKRRRKRIGFISAQFVVGISSQCFVVGISSQHFFLSFFILISQSLILDVPKFFA